MFINPLDPENVLIKKKIAEWLMHFQMIDKESNVLITEIPHCIDRPCPDSTTQITIIKPDGKEQLIKISKPLVYIRKWDIDAIRNTLTI